MTERKGDQKLLLWSLTATERHINIFFKLHAMQPYSLHSGAAGVCSQTRVLAWQLSKSQTLILQSI